MNEYLILYTCEDCETSFGLFKEREKPSPWCPNCGNDDTGATAELYKGEVVPDDRDW